MQPLIRPELPTQSNAITERMNELMFQSAFMRELELVKDNQNTFKAASLVAWKAGIEMA
ncbi:MAG: hypothetical protein LRY63_14295 [Nitrincola sp.]|nr:hypothetical protein [Nitrincola sp.]